MWVASGIALLVKPCMLWMKIMIWTIMFNAFISWTVNISIHVFPSRSSCKEHYLSILCAVELHVNCFS
jgi:hypothetical protein